MNSSKNGSFELIITSKRAIQTVLIFIFLLSCRNLQKEEASFETIPVEEELIYTTPLGIEITLSEPSEKSVDQYKTAMEQYENNPDDVDTIIWFGRRTAYLGKYDDAIALYSQGIKKFPEDARLYRHRGHRYISLRKFDKAIADLEKAGQLIQNTENEIEPDGMPNVMNIPVSTLHGNIWYHLGLAYYLNTRL